MAKITAKKPSHKRLKICMLTDCYAPSIGGIENHIVRLSNMLRDMRHRVTIITHKAIPHRHNNGNNAQIADYTETDVIRVPGLVVCINGDDPLFDPVAMHKINNIVRDNHFDIVHGHSYGSFITLTGLMTAKRIGVPTVLTKHSTNMTGERPGIINHVMLTAERLCMNRFCDAIITVTKTTANELGQTQTLKYVVPCGVDCEQWCPKTERRQRVRTELGFQDEHVVIGFLSRFIRTKGLVHLIKIFRRIIEDLPYARLLLVGDGPLYTKVDRMITRYNLQNHVVMTGFQPWDMTPAFLNAMDIFAFPSYKEAFATALAEAMSCGLPVVSSINDGALELIENGESGFLAKNHDEFYISLMKLTIDDSLRKQIGERSRKFIQKHCNWSVVAEKTVQVYKETVMRRA
jgi:glycosyltransferase involved in cell wall biosynthesis